MTARAVVVDERDTVATALADLAAGELPVLPIGDQERRVDLTAPIAFGYKLALTRDRGRRSGGQVWRGDRARDPADRRRRPRASAQSGGPARPGRPAVKEPFLGCLRPGGAVGARNLLLLASSMDVTNPLARRIAAAVEDAVAITTAFGRIDEGSERAQHERTLAGLIRNPNRPWPRLTQAPTT